MATYFASDYHLGHKNIIKYDGRPFKTVEEMDEAIIAAHNKVISPKDDFYYLGDFCFNNRAEEYLDRLNGSMYFIKGNHDRSDMVKLYKRYGNYLGMMDEVYVEGQMITLNHYRMDVWNKSHRGSWHLFGHSHHSLIDNIHARSIDVGINGPTYNYTPQSFEQIKRMMEKKQWKPIDHHGK